VTPPTGYSGTPLARKLGIGEGATVWTSGAPRGYRALLAPLPDGVRITAAPAARTAADVLHVFTTRRAELASALAELYDAVLSDAAVWVSWPKKSAGVATDVTEDVIREVALPLGFVDVKVCAVDAVWSGLKLVVRKENRAGREARRGARGMRAAGRARRPGRGEER
jgi:hypothetical protein